jgi:hypothetical protein
VKAPAVRFEPVSANRKLAPSGWTPAEVRPRPHALGPFCATTSVSIEATCPATCVWKSTPGHQGACYAQAGFSVFLGRRLDAEARDLAPDDVVRAEADLIKKAFRGGPVPQDGPDGKGRALRLHVAGEIEGRPGAKALGEAAVDWMDRGGSRPWSYTHRWREVHRRYWGPISVLASVEDPREMNAVAKQGYAPALVVAEFPQETAFKLRGWSIVPCPYETRQVTCLECQLCWRGDALLSSKTGIGFAVHGPRRYSMRIAR